jgi:hypothetical protein
MVERYGLGLLSQDEERRIETHALGCDECFRNLYREGLVTGLLCAGTEMEASPSGEEAQAPQEEPGEAAPPGAWSRRRWAFVMTGTAAAAIVAALALRVLIPWGDAEQVRGPEEDTIRILAPVGMVPAPRELRWEPLPVARSYEVRIHTQRGRLVWQGTVERPPAPLPDSVRDSLATGETYFWQVEALSLEGIVGKSELTRFTVRE